MNPKLLPLAAASYFLCLGAIAQTTDAPVSTLGDVIVRAGTTGALTPSTLLTSVDVLGADKIEDQTVAQSWELVGRLPGIQLTETRMGAESGKATFRAFNGEGYINGIKVLIDGIPSNVNSGNQRFIDMIFPLEIDYIEVVRGTNDPRYGLHNIGGNIHVGTRQGGEYTDARFTLGSHDTREVQLALGRESERLAQNYFVAYQAANGDRPHARSEKYTLGGKWFTTLADGRVKAGLVARLYEHRAQEPGFMTAAELAQDRDQSFSKNANDGSDRDMRHVSAHVDWQVTPTLFMSNKLYANHYADERRITFTDSQAASLNNLPRQRRVWNEDQTGLLSTLTWRGSRAVVVEGGINLERQRNEYTRQRFAFAIPTDFSQPTATSNDDHHTLNNVGAYVQAVIQATDRLKLVPGWRVDRFSGNTTQNNGAHGPLQDYGWIDQPKLSMVYSISDELSIYANWGRTFQILTGSRAPAYLTSPTQKHFSPSINTGQELGLKFKPSRHTETRIAWWQQDATDEVANMPATGTTVGLGETRRTGLDLQASTRLGTEWALWASHSLQKAEVVSAFTGTGVSLAGKEVFSTPRHVSNVGVEWRATPDLRLGLQGRSQGSYFIDELNAKGKFGSFVLFDANARYQLSARTSVDLQIKNLADRHHVYAWDDTFFWPAGSTQPMFSPGAGRAAFVSLNFKL
jgi:iron complex outermembrane receptor protein